MMTAVGVPMIWMGEEFGEHVPMSEQSNKIDWTLLENDANKDLREYYRTLIRFRTSNPACRSNNVDFFHEDPDAGVLCFQRFDDEGSVIVVALNLSDDTLEDYTVTNFPLDGPCREITNDSALVASESAVTLDLPRRAGFLFTKGEADG
ncbi:MAG: hypothetical protein HOP17_07005 [Acidobacteria bacterium]|nr:hypothetical protein [Acidobacteriota bacterium]